MMDFILDTPEAAAAALSDALLHALDKHSRVLWLVPGGSNIAVATAAMATIPDDATSRLHIMLSDERYGEVGHADSNFRQIEDSGFNARQAVLLPVLTAGADIEETTRAYAECFEREQAAAGALIALLGMGPDAHIAGILPGSPAASAESLTTHYRSDPFERITLTFPALKNIDIAFVGAYGKAKQTALASLQAGNKPLTEQPCQILHTLPEVYVYNDVIAGEGVTA
jgi:6-phosphogluconolactonase/glucosamine-6-phosphate isomerase/deaminase